MISVLEAIEVVLKQDVGIEIREICDELKISATLRDAMLYRLERARPDHFYIEAAKQGSFEIFAVLAASAYFVMDKTIGKFDISKSADAELCGDLDHSRVMPGCDQHHGRRPRQCAAHAGGDQSGVQLTFPGPP